MTDDRLTLPELATERLLLRPVTAADVAEVYALGSDPEVVRHVFWPRHETTDDSLRFIRFLNAPDITTAGIEPRDIGRLVGWVFFHSRERHHRRIEIAFHLVRDHWGHGYATEAVQQVIAHAFMAWPVHRIVATCTVSNDRSARVLERAGFTYEGTMRGSHRRGDEFLDMKLFARLAGDRPMPEPPSSPPAAGPAAAAR